MSFSMYFVNKPLSNNDQKIQIKYLNQDRYNFTWGLFVDGTFKKSLGVPKASKHVARTFGYKDSDFTLMVV